MKVLQKLGMASDFRKNVGRLFTGAVASQLISVCTSPILSRLYTPKDFGLLALFNAVASVPIVIACARYEVAIPLPKTEGEANQLVALAFEIAAVVSIIFVVAGLTVGHVTGTYFSLPKFSGALPLLGLTVLLTGLSQTLSYWTIRRGFFGKLSKNRIIQSVVGPGTSMLLAATVLKPFGMIIANVVALFVGTAVFVAIYFADQRPRLSQISFKQQRVLAATFSHFPKYNAFHAFTDIAQTSAISFLLSGFFGQGVLGSYALANRVLNLPMAVVGAAVAQVFYGRISEQYAKREAIFPTTVRLVLGLITFGIACFGVLWIAGEPLVVFAFGSQWRLAGKFLTALIPWVFALLVASPISHIPIVCGQQRTALCLNVVKIVLIVSALFIASRSLPAESTLAWTAGVAALCNVGYGSWCMLVAKRADLRRKPNDLAGEGAKPANC